MKRVLKEKGRTSTKILAGVSALLILFLTALFWGFNTKLPQIDDNINVFEKIKDISNQSGQLVLNEQDLNELCQFLLPNGYQFNSLFIKGAYTVIGEHGITVKMPVKYKGISLLLISTMTLEYQNNRIIATPVRFYIGAIPIPKGIVMDYLRRKSGSKLSIQDQKIILGIEKLSGSFHVNSLKVEAHNIILRITGLNIANQMEILIDKEMERYENVNQASESEKVKGQKSHSSTVGNSTKSVKASTITGSSTKKTPASISKTERSRILGSAAAQMNRAAAKVSSSKVKSIIYSAKSTLSRMKANPDYHYQRDLFSLKSMYDKLTDQEKEKLKAAIFQSVDTRSLMKIYTNK